MRSKLRLLILFVAGVAGFVVQFCATDPDDEQAPAPEAVSPTPQPDEPAEPPPPSFEFDKPHRFEELHEAYQVHWAGEQKGNKYFDGKRTTVRGTVWGVGGLSRLQDDGSSLAVYSNLQFRSAKFDGRDTGYDFECQFKPEEKEALKEKAPEGTSVLLSGTILMQEIYIEPGFTYRKLSLKDCEILAEK